MKRAAAKKSVDVKGFFAHHKKKILIMTGVVGVVTAFTVYVIWSVLSWQHIGSNAVTTQRSIKADIAALATQKTASQELANRAEDIKSSLETLCVVSPLIEWQLQLFGGAREAQAHCEQAKQRMKAVQTALEAIVQRVASEQRMAQKLQALQSKLAKMPKDDYTTSRETWNTFRTEIERDTAHSSLDTSKQAAHDASQDIVAGYDKLLAANKAQKRADFDGAVAEIEKGYSKLGAIQNSSVDSYSALLDALQNASSKLN